MFAELDRTRASVALQASQIIAQLQPLTVVDAVPGAAAVHRVTIKWKPQHSASNGAAPASANGKKRRKRTEITPAMRKMVLDMSKDKENTAKIIAKAVGISAPSVFAIRTQAKAKKKTRAKAAPASAR